MRDTTDPAPTDPLAARVILEQRRTALRAELAEGIEAPGQMTYGSQAAAASQVFAQQRDLALRDKAIRDLALVDAALARLDDGTYGRCVTCGRPVGAERLEALPWADRCIDCQRRAGG
ncbi:MAG: TraR/DksA family transcriptional regulator [Candidatus Limnocylindrales bacterium]